MARYSTAGGYLQININGVQTNIDGVENFNGPTGQKTEIEMTALSDTAAVSAPGTPDFGQFTMTVFDNPGDAGNARLLASFNTNPGPTEQFTYKLPFTGTGNTLTFNAYVQQWALQQEKASGGKYNCTLRATGTVART
jgi:hypothetical protein